MAAMHPDQLALFQAQPGEPACNEPHGVVVARLAVPVATAKPHKPNGQPDQSLHVDWFKVITALVRGGYSLSSIASHVRVPKSTLIGWKQGAEPRYSEGERLLSFWCQITGKNRKTVPMVAVGDWWAYHSKA